MLPVQKVLQSKKVVLASGSPRRAEILRNIGLEFEMEESGFDENLPRSDYASHGEYARAIASEKASKVASRWLAVDKHCLVIGADTIVTKGDRIYGKPKTEDEAREMLTDLSGQWHEVHTGIALVYSGRPPAVWYVTTGVKMGQLDPKTIQEYVTTGEPMDKAGAYGIQGLGGTLVEKIEGDYFNVVGFPLNSFCTSVVSMEVQGWFKDSE